LFLRIVQAARSSFFIGVSAPHPARGTLEKRDGRCWILAAKHVDAGEPGVIFAAVIRLVRRSSGQFVPFQVSAASASGVAASCGRRTLPRLPA